MKKAIYWMGLMLFFSAMFSTRVVAKNFSFTDRSRAMTFSSEMALGFTIDPDTFALTLGADFFVHHNIALVPMMQMGFSDDFTFVAPTFNIRGMVDLPGVGFLNRVKPLLLFGFGFLYGEIDRHIGDDDDLELLLNIGIGVDFYLTTHFALGNRMIFNIIPTELFGYEEFIFAWQFLTIKYHF